MDPRTHSVRVQNWRTRFGKQRQSHMLGGTCTNALFRDFDHGLNFLIADVLPNIFAPKGHRARMELGNAFQQYFENFAPAQSAAIIRGRYDEATRYGITPLEQGRLEVGTLIGILANTIPSIF